MKKPPHTKNWMLLYAQFSSEWVTYFISIDQTCKSHGWLNSLQRMYGHVTTVIVKGHTAHDPVFRSLWKWFKIWHRNAIDRSIRRLFCFVFFERGKEKGRRGNIRDVHSRLCPSLIQSLKSILKFVSLDKYRIDLPSAMEFHLAMASDLINQDSPKRIYNSKRKWWLSIGTKWLPNPWTDLSRLDLN